MQHLRQLPEGLSSHTTNQEQPGYLDTAINKSGLLGKFKVWIYQHGVLPRILWPLIVYEVPQTTVEVLEKSINLRRWLGLPWSLRSFALCSHSINLQLPFSRPSGLTRSSKVLMYGDSADVKLTSTGKTGRKWQAEEALTRAEAQNTGGLRGNWASRSWVLSKAAL